MARPIIPETPTYWFKGVEQPASFAAGVRAFENLLVRVQDEDDNAPSDREVSERLAEYAVATFGATEGERLGFAAAMIEWLAIARHSHQDPETWLALQTPPRSREVGGADFEDPGPRSRFFDVNGVPVTVSPDLACYSFGESDADYFALDEVREHGREITRDEFDELRERATAMTTEAANG